MIDEKVKAKVNVTLKFLDELETLAWDVYKQLYELDPRRYNKFIAEHGGDVTIECGDVVIRGDEYWRYGGHEEHYGSYPAQWLYDDSWKEEIRAAVALRNRKEAEEKAAADAEKARRREAKRHAMYKKLKAEFEGD